MSKSSRKHLAPAKLAKRGPKNRSDGSETRAIRKPAKQTRANERTRLRKEFT